MVQKEEEQSNMKLDDILKSIRGIIDGKDPEQAEGENLIRNIYNKSFTQDHLDEEDSEYGEDSGEILELTTEHNSEKEHVTPNISSKKTQEDEDYILLSSEAKEKTSNVLKGFSKRVEEHKKHIEQIKVEKLAKEMLKPMLEEWLNRNIASVVEKAIEKEMKKLFREQDIFEHIK